MADPVVAYVALGSNLDDPRSQVERAFAALDRLPRTHVVARSRLYRTPPWGVVEQPPFVNAAARLETSLPARGLLDGLLAIEQRAGRVRGVRNGPRVLDLDLLVYGGITASDPDLVLPHPRLHERAFVLVPLVDLDPALEIPGRGRVHELLAGLDAAGCVALD